ncbi:acyltransferase family protein [Pseudomonas inefficax]|uniref:acyltransferase family protein n=1 Tax=Pseudomonas TaxID=286 RepID=UPI001C0063AB|nr:MULTISPECIES: acyltransferase family protein [Pseudomonas]MBT9234964.1 acyltransferase [Pseudomonas sp. MG-2]WNN38193.1 acyltransferase family protein [Pseudomonas inefficax]
MSSALVFRRDIAGLRAVAVIGVLLFHLGFSWVPGGFAGVDVFFVISGYLITSILLRDAASETFSFSNFYLRRIKRLLPAALVVTISSLIAGYFLLDPAGFENLASSALYASFFSANIYFYLNSGYFDASSEESPLLHMWSLGVEEQFYIFFPLIVIALLSRSRRIAFFGIAAIFVASFIFCLFMAFHDPMFGFYMFPMRAWELGVGCLLAFSIGSSASAYLRQGLALLGLVLIVGSMLLLNKGLSYPSYWAAIPVLGTALLIHFGREVPFTERCLGFWPMQFIGKISYSVYLWHWPLIVFYRAYWSGKELSLTESLVLLTISLFMGWISWKYVEEKIRTTPIRPRFVVGTAAMATCLLALLAGTVLFSNGFESRLVRNTAELTDIKKMWDWTCVEQKLVPGGGPSCVVGASWKSAEKHGVIWGDSHSEHFAAILDSIASKKNISIVIAPRSCPPYLNLKYVGYNRPDAPLFGQRCSTKQELMLKWVNESNDIDFIIMAAAWSGHGENLASISADVTKHGPELMYDSFSALLSGLRLDGRKLLLLGEIPRLNFSYNACAGASLGIPFRQCYYDFRTLNYTTVTARHEPYNRVLRQLALDWKAKVLLPSQMMCTRDSCGTFFGGEFIYRDSNHLRRNLKPETNAVLANVIGLNGFIDEL